MLTTHVVAVPLHAPVQPLNIDPLLGVAFNVTDVPAAKLLLHFEPQLTPAGLLVTGPLPLPAFVMLSVKPWLNVAVTLFAASIVTKQLLDVPLQAPDQPVKNDPLFAVAVSATSVPRANDAWHLEPQAIPEGALETGPLPVPDLKTVKTGVLLNVAVTLLAVLMVTVQEEVPEHAPDQPAKTEPAFGVAVKVTLLPLGNRALQPLPHAIPAGELVTGPLPSPALATVSR